MALAFARKFPGTVGFDIHREKVDELRRGYDRNHEVPEDGPEGDLAQDDERPGRPRGAATFFVVAVPTPVDANNVPDLTAGRAAHRRRWARSSRKGAVVVYESTVYPGVTEDICGPILGAASRPEARRRLQARLLARAHQPRRQGAHARAASPRWCRGEDDGDARARRGTPTARSSRRACTARRASRSPRPRRSSRTRSATSTSR